MRVASTAVSLTTHVLVVLAVLSSTTNGKPNPPRPPTIVDVLPGPIQRTRASGSEALPMPVVGSDVVVPPIDVTKVDGLDALMPRVTVDVPIGSGLPLATGTPGEGSAWDPSLVDQLPMLLSGPVPAYPDLLRQAGLQGRVVLEAVIDTSGHVEPASVVVVESAHPAFVAPAQHALLKSLFRPARVRGTAVRVRVRVPIDFVLRGVRLLGR